MAVGSAAGRLAYGLGLLFWPRGLDRPFRIAGVVLVLAGLAKALAYPFAYSAAFGAMTPLLNTPSLVFLFAIAALLSLTLNRPEHHWPFETVSLRPAWSTLLAVAVFSVIGPRRDHPGQVYVVWDWRPGMAPTTDGFYDGRLMIGGVGSLSFDSLPLFRVLTKDRATVVAAFTRTQAVWLTRQKFPRMIHVRTTSRMIAPSSIYRVPAYVTYGPV